MKIKHKILGILFTGIFFSCTGDFEEINQDPNRIQKSTPESFMAPAIYNLTSAQMRYGHRLGNEFVQYTVQTNEINEFHRFIVPAIESNSIWTSYYTNLTDIEDMQRQAEARGNTNYLAISKILKTLAFSNLTDYFGPVPYTEALKGDTENNLQPAFDEQAEIYSHLLSELEEANDLFNLDGSINASNDILYNGDLLKWKKFGNSLHLRLLLRVSGKPAMNASQKIAEIFGNPDKYPVFTDGDDAAVLHFAGVTPNINPFYSWRDFEFNGNRGFSELFINTLKDFNDPRLEQIATTTAEGDYIGVLSGRGSGDEIPSGYATYKPELKSAGQPGILFSYAEVEFILAEAAMNNWITGDAAAHYAKGIEDAMDFWGVDVPAGYMDQPGVAFDGQMETLMKQKWLALFGTGLEGWAEYRRTGLPELPIGPAVSNDGIVPTRMPYPGLLQSLNAANYNDAVSKLGADDLKTPLWWQN